jgi:signal transduction histidine kinase
VFNTISSRINHLSKFVRNYSDLAKQYTPNKSTVNVTQLLENLNPLYPFTQVDSFACDNISADAGQLEQVFINLLKNAQEASSQGQGKGHVEVSVSNLDNNRILITIEDDGPGIPPAMLNEVMLPFRSTKQAGTGIGLSVCKEIIDSHQGQLVLKNQVSGTGLRVEVILPKG